PSRTPSHEGPEENAEGAVDDTATTATTAPSRGRRRLLATLVVAEQEGDADRAARGAEEAVVEAHEQIGQAHQRRLDAGGAGMEADERAQHPHPVHLEQAHQVLREVEALHHGQALLREPGSDLVLVNEPEVAVCPGPDAGLAVPAVEETVHGVVGEGEPQ